MSAQQKPHDPWTHFALAVFRLNGLILQAGEGIARPIGQSSARWQVLGRAFERQSVADIARDIGHARQSVQRVADILAKEGLVIYRPHPADRRTKLVALTPAGLNVLTAIYKRQLAWSERTMAKLQPGQLAAIADNLHKIGDILGTDLGKKAKENKHPNKSKAHNF